MSCFNVYGYIFSCIASVLSIWSCVVARILWSLYIDDQQKGLAPDNVPIISICLKWLLPKQVMVFLSWDDMHNTIYPFSQTHHIHDWFCSCHEVLSPYKDAGSYPYWSLNWRPCMLFPLQISSKTCYWKTCCFMNSYAVLPGSYPASLRKINWVVYLPRIWLFFSNN